MSFKKDNGFESYFKQILDGNEREENTVYDREVGSYVYCGLIREDRLISEDEMLGAFRENLAEIIRMSRIDYWKEAIYNVFDGTEDVDRIFQNAEIKAEEIIEENFCFLSSGQKIMLHIFTKIVVSMTEDCLLLIDEPEIHLHPNAISNFMRVLNKLLQKFNSFAIISTHSPIVLQEIPARYVRIFDNSEFYEDKLWEECFGDNISSIIKNVFNVRPDESNYKTFFHKKKEEGLRKEQIERMFDTGLSMNAQMYLNILYKDDECYEKTDGTC